MKKSTLATRCLIAFLLLAGIVAVLWNLNRYAGTGISPRLLLFVRWAALVAVCG